MWRRLLPFAAALAVVAVGLPVDLMEIDAAQYAELSRQMLDTGRFLQVQSYGQDYLDKPPLLFWSAALSYALFGVSSAAYRLPALAFAALAVVSTWRLGRLLYSREVGVTCALLLASCQGLFAMTLDSRTDALLMGSVAAALWQGVAFLQAGRRVHLWLACAAVALAMLAKGPMGAAIPASAFAVHLALRRERPPLTLGDALIGLLLILALLSPMLLGLAAQHGWPGIRFYFWDQSVGRLTGASPWRDDSTPFYFLSTISWTFLPWSFALGLGLAERFGVLFRQRFRLRGSQEFLGAGGFAVTFLALSLLRYKLSHYIFVALPFAALVAGPYLSAALAPGRDALGRSLVRLQGLVCAGVFAAGVLIAGVLFGPPTAPVVAVGLGAALAAGLLFARGPSPFERAVLAPAIAMLAVNFAINAQVSPALLSYQAPSQVAHRLPELGVAPERLFTYRTRPHSLGFYAGTQVELLPSPEAARALASGGGLWIYTDDQGLRELRGAGLAIASAHALPHFPVSRLNPRFLAPASRAATLDRRHLVAIAAPEPRAYPGSVESSSSRLPSGSRK